MLTEGIYNLLLRSLHLAFTVPLQTSQPRLLGLKVEMLEKFSKFQDGVLHQVLNIQSRVERVNVRVQLPRKTRRDNPQTWLTLTNLATIPPNLPDRECVIHLCVSLCQVLPVNAAEDKLSECW